MTTPTPSLTLLFTFLLTITRNTVALTVDFPISNVSTTNKAGLAWGASADVSMSQFTSTGKVSWYYDWSPQTYVKNNNLEYVPMLWGAKDLSEWNATINTTIQSGEVTAILGMNEPDQSGQSNLSPEAASEMWTTYVQPLRAQGLRLGSPATASEPTGIDWVQQFIGNCSNCGIDFITIHWYGTNAAQFEDYLTNWHTTFQKPLWITEWACQNNDGGAQCSQSEVDTFMNATETFMDSQDWVERYSWFGAMESLDGVNPDNALMTSSGTINTLGNQYIGAQFTSSTPAAGGAVGLTSCSSSRWSTLALVTIAGLVLL